MQFAKFKHDIAYSSYSFSSGWGQGWGYHQQCMAAIDWVYSVSPPFCWHHSNACSCGKICWWAVHTSRQHSAVCIHIQSAQETTLNASKINYTSFISRNFYQNLFDFAVFTNFCTWTSNFTCMFPDISVGFYLFPCTRLGQNISCGLCEGGWLVYREELSRYDTLLLTRESHDSVTTLLTATGLVCGIYYPPSLSLSHSTCFLCPGDPEADGWASGRYQCCTRHK